jgi:crotonobetainyl-CoA:carnitine CoA-transferase CaiB-like acyl-CoA transferase
MDNPWLTTIGMRDQVAHPDNPELKVLANPIRINGERLPNRAGPLLGADSDAILAELGYDVGDVARLKAEGIV